MNITLWIIQGLLAVLFLLAGVNKTFQPMDTLAKMLPWTRDFPAAFVRFIGVSELLGAIGLIVPALTHILPWLTVVAAIGLAVVIVGAVFFHLSRREFPAIALNIVIIALAVFVIYGRLVLSPL